MRQLDEEIGDVHTLMADVAVEVLHQLTASILEHESTLISYGHGCSVLDWYRKNLENPP